VISKSHREFWLLLSYVYIKYNKTKKALKLLAALYKLFPEDIEIIRLFSYAKLKNGNYNDALDLIDKYLNLCVKGQRKTGYLIKSKILWRLNKKQMARDFMKKFIES
jgi:tetratricopeptide (TPR) repeat protein